MRPLLTALACLALAAPASAQTVREVSDARRSCTTEDVVGLSAQLSEFQRECLRPGAFVRIDDHPRVSARSSRVHPYMQATARDAVHAAADMGFDIAISSAFRTVADQYVLQQSVGHPGGCGAAAAPGGSRHQSGRAIDVGEWETLMGPLEASGCAWLGRTVPSDPFHFDCPGMDLGADAVLAFQTLWNVNHPEDVIDEDGVYGPQTQMRLEMSPASGFATSGCGGCTPGCEGDVRVGADCARTPCAATEACMDDGAGDVRCAPSPCLRGGSLVRGASICLADGRSAITCDADGRAADTEACPAGQRCVEDTGGATCASTAAPDGGGTDAGTGPGRRPGDSGCGCRAAGSPRPAPAGGPTALVAVLLLALRRLPLGRARRRARLRG